MKKSMSKKVLAVFLSALMVLTALPLTVFASEEANSIDSAISAYETKMSEVKTNQAVYTNMENAYKAYVKAVEAKKANKDVETAAQELKSATEAMEKAELKAPVFTQPVFLDNGENQETEEDKKAIAENSSNILYAGTDYTNKEDRVVLKCSDAFGWVYYDCIEAYLKQGTTVLLYDGENTPQFPAMFLANRIGGYVPYLNNVFVKNNEFSVYDKNRVENNNKEWNGKNGQNYSRHFGLVFNSTEHIKAGADCTVNDYVHMNGTPYSFATSVKFNGSLSDNEYTKAFPMKWEVRYDVDASKTSPKEIAGAPVYVVNYKVLKDAYKAVCDSAVLSDVKSYVNDANTVKYMQAIDALTSFNFKSYDFSKDTKAVVEKAGQDIKTIVENLKVESTLKKLADFKAYNAAKAELVAKLDSVKYTDTALEAVIETLGELKYLDKAVQEKTEISAQESIDAETAKFDNALSKLVETEEASKYEDTYNAIVAKSKALNSDAYNRAKVDEFVKAEPVSEKYDILGKEYQGYTYDRAGTRILTAISSNMYEYSVKVVNAATGAEIKKIDKQHYGDVVELSQDEACDWAESHIAKNTSVETKRMLIQTNSAKCTVTVQGDTTVYVSVPKSDNVNKVTFVDSITKKEVAFGYAKDGSFDIKDAFIPTRFGYVINGYTVENATIKGTMITDIKGDVTVKVNYVPEKTVKNYTITVKDYNNEVKEKKTAKFNDLVTVTDNDAKAWVNANNENEVLAYGKTYKFFATQNMEVKPVKEVEEKACVTVSDSVELANSTMLVGSFALPTNLEFVSAGIVLDLNNTMENPTLADVNNAKEIYNFSVSSYDKVSNQFVVEVKGDIKNATYRSYLTYKDSKGESYTVYSAVKTVK